MMPERGSLLSPLCASEGFPKVVLDLRERGKLLLVHLKWCWLQSTLLNELPDDLLNP